MGLSAGRVARQATAAHGHVGLVLPVSATERERQRPATASRCEMTAATTRPIEFAANVMRATRVWMPAMGRAGCYGHRGTRRPPPRDCAHHFVMPVLRSTSPMASASIRSGNSAGRMTHCLWPNDTLWASCRGTGYSSPTHQASTSVPTLAQISFGLEWRRQHCDRCQTMQ